MVQYRPNINKKAILHLIIYNFAIDKRINSFYYFVSTELCSLFLVINIYFIEHVY